jgi:hypothetical protein
MKMFKKVLFGAMIAAPLLMAPATTKAGPIGDLLKEIFGGLGKNQNGQGQNHNGQGQNGQGQHGQGQNNPGAPGTAAPGNSVPINGGLVMLLAAGLGLGAKVIYDNKLRKTVPAVI